jgi:hypothetical protein
MGDDQIPVFASRPYLPRRQPYPRSVLALWGVLMGAVAVMAYTAKPSDALRARWAEDGALAHVEAVAAMRSDRFVSVELVFQGGQRFTLGRLRDHKTWPSACFQCARPISDANWPVDMWTGLDSRHCFAGCFECWKDVMRCRSFCLESYEGPH